MGVSGCVFVSTVYSLCLIFVVCAVPIPQENHKNCNISESKTPLDDVSNRIEVIGKSEQFKQHEGADLFEELEKTKSIKLHKEFYVDKQYTTLCWVERTKIFEKSNGTKLVRREFSIFLQSPADIPDEYIDPPNPAENKEVLQYELYNSNTKKSRLVNFTTISRKDDEIIRENSKYMCGSGPVLTKEYTEWPSSNRKRIEIKVSPDAQNLKVINCSSRPLSVQKSTTNSSKESILTSAPNINNDTISSGNNKQDTTSSENINQNANGSEKSAATTTTSNDVQETNSSEDNKQNINGSEISEVTTKGFGSTRKPQTSGSEIVATTAQSGDTILNTKSTDVVVSEFKYTSEASANSGNAKKIGATKLEDLSSETQSPKLYSDTSTDSDLFSKVSEKLASDLISPNSTTTTQASKKLATSAIGSATETPLSENTFTIIKDSDFIPISPENDFDPLTTSHLIPILIEVSEKLPQGTLKGASLTQSPKNNEITKDNDLLSKSVTKVSENNVNNTVESTSETQSAENDFSETTTDSDLVTKSSTQVSDNFVKNNTVGNATEIKSSGNTFANKTTGDVKSKSVIEVSVKVSKSNVKSPVNNSEILTSKSVTKVSENNVKIIIENASETQPHISDFSETTTVGDLVSKASPKLAASKIGTVTETPHSKYTYKVTEDSDFVSKSVNAVSEKLATTSNNKNFATTDLMPKPKSHGNNTVNSESETQLPEIYLDTKSDADLLPKSSTNVSENGSSTKGVSETETSKTQTSVTNKHTTTKYSVLLVSKSAVTVSEKVSLSTEKRTSETQPERYSFDFDYGTTAKVDNGLTPKPQQTQRGSEKSVATTTKSSDVDVQSEMESSEGNEMQTSNSATTKNVGLIGATTMPSNVVKNELSAKPQAQKGSENIAATTKDSHVGKPQTKPKNKTQTLDNNETVVATAKNNDLVPTTTVLSNLVSGDSTTKFGIIDRNDTANLVTATFSGQEIFDHKTDKSTTETVVSGSTNNKIGSDLNGTVTLSIYSTDEDLKTGTYGFNDLDDKSTKSATKGIASNQKNEDGNDKPNGTKLEIKTTINFSFKDQTSGLYQSSTKIMPDSGDRDKKVSVTESNYAVPNSALPNSSIVLNDTIPNSATAPSTLIPNLEPNSLIPNSAKAPNSSIPNSAIVLNSSTPNSAKDPNFSTPNSAIVPNSSIPNSAKAPNTLIPNLEPNSSIPNSAKASNSSIPNSAKAPNSSTPNSAKEPNSSTPNSAIVPNSSIPNSAKVPNSASIPNSAIPNNHSQNDLKSTTKFDNGVVFGSTKKIGTTNNLIAIASVARNTLRDKSTFGLTKLPDYSGGLIWFTDDKSRLPESANQITAEHLNTKSPLSLQQFTTTYPFEVSSPKTLSPLAFAQTGRPFPTFSYEPSYFDASISPDLSYLLSSSPPSSFMPSSSLSSLYSKPLSSSNSFSNLYRPFSLVSSFSGTYPGSTISPFPNSYYSKQYSQYGKLVDRVATTHKTSSLSPSRKPTEIIITPNLNKHNNNTSSKKSDLQTTLGGSGERETFFNDVTPSVKDTTKFGVSSNYQKASTTFEENATLKSIRISSIKPLPDHQRKPYQIIKDHQKYETPSVEDTTKFGVSTNYQRASANFEENATQRYIKPLPNNQRKPYQILKDHQKYETPSVEDTTKFGVPTNYQRASANFEENASQRYIMPLLNHRQKPYQILKDHQKYETPSVEDTTKFGVSTNYQRASATFEENATQRYIKPLPNHQLKPYQKLIDHQNYETPSVEDTTKFGVSTNNQRASATFDKNATQQSVPSLKPIPNRPQNPNQNHQDVSQQIQSHTKNDNTQEPYVRGGVQNKNSTFEEFYDYNDNPEFDFEFGPADSETTIDYTITPMATKSTTSVATETTGGNNTDTNTATTSKGINVQPNAVSESMPPYEPFPQDLPNSDNASIFCGNSTKQKLIVRIKLLVEHQLQSNASGQVQQRTSPVLALEKRTDFDLGNETLFEEPKMPEHDIKKDWSKFLNDLGKYYFGLSRNFFSNFSAIPKRALDLEEAKKEFGLASEGAVGRAWGIDEPPADCGTNNGEENSDRRLSNRILRNRLRYINRYKQLKGFVAKRTKPNLLGIVQMVPDLQEKMRIQHLQDELFLSTNLPESVPIIPNAQENSLVSNLPKELPLQNQQGLLFAGLPKTVPGQVPNFYAPVPNQHYNNDPYQNAYNAQEIIMQIPQLQDGFFPPNLLAKMPIVPNLHEEVVIAPNLQPNIPMIPNLKEDITIPNPPRKLSTPNQQKVLIENVQNKIPGRVPNAYVPVPNQNANYGAYQNAKSARDDANNEILRRVLSPDQIEVLDKTNGKETIDGFNTKSLEKDELQEEDRVANKMFWRILAKFTSILDLLRKR